MEKKYTLKGLDCPNCAAKIQNEISKVSGINSASVDLMTESLTIETDRGDRELFSDIEKAVHMFEPDVSVSERISERGARSAHDHCSGKQKNDGQVHSGGADDFDERSPLLRIIIGGFLLAAGVIISRFTKVNPYLSVGIYTASFLTLGYDVLFSALRNIINGRVFDENFLMSIASVGAFAIGEYPEAATVMLLYQIGEMFEKAAVGRSKRSISALMDIRPDTACVIRDGEELTVHPEEVDIGELILLRPGEKVPLDGVVEEGDTYLDMSALSGESRPVHAYIGSEVLSGGINKSGTVKVRTTKEFGESTATKIIDAVRNASSRKAPAENFITKFAKYYTPAVVGGAILLCVVPTLFFGLDFTTWFRRACTFLIVSCPCALVISVPLTFFGGIGAASRAGVLVKGSNYLELLSKLDAVIFDKTGTLTKGEFRVKEVIPADGVSKDDVLKYAAYAEAYSTHPIAESITAEATYIDRSKISDYTEISGHGVSVLYDGKKLLAGNEKLISQFGIKYDDCSAIGTKVYVAADSSYLGCIVIADSAKEDSAETISELKKLGIKKIVMLTGDSEEVARSVAGELGIDEYRASLLPGEKAEILWEIAKKDSESPLKVAFVGDGINDSPVLASADVGISMGQIGSDAAIEASDVVLMTDEPSKLIDAVAISKKTRHIVVENITFALAVKAILLVLGACGISGMWEAVFGDVGVTMLAVLNSMRMMKNK